ncbi:MAG: hypothetical protein M3401_16045 [Actinomycetota bacterium]|nr:hypothetical protein [Actinomycetota bacterium]
MHPAEHRGLRELYVSARQLRQHWRRLADRMDAIGAGGVDVLRAGSDEARALLGELTDVTAARGLYGKPAAQGLGARVAGMRNTLVDPTLEVSQVLRFAVLDVQHVVTLLGYLARLAARREDEELRAFLAAWEERMRAHEDAIRALAIALGDTPDDAIVPSTPGLGGRAAHGLAAKVGTAGEWFDGRAGR